MRGIQDKADDRGLSSELIWMSIYLSTSSVWANCVFALRFFCLLSPSSFILRAQYKYEAQSLQMLFPWLIVVYNSNLGFATEEISYRRVNGKTLHTRSFLSETLTTIIVEPVLLISKL